MGKFNMAKINGLDTIKEKNGENGTAVGAGLLSAVSKQLATDDMRLIYLDREQIMTNPRNFYSISDVDSLKQSIKAVGLRQPLEVLQNPDGSYRLTGGERRLTAIDELIQEGSWDKKIPCILQELEKITLPLSDEDKEMFAIITVNREQREYTDGDTAKEIAEVKKIYKKLKEQGVEWVETEAGERIQIKGKKTRELVAETLGISTGQVSNFEKVENKGSAALKESLLNNELSIGTAAEIASLPKQEQDELIQQTKKEKSGRIEKADVQKFSKEKEKKKAVELKKTEESVTISSEDTAADSENIELKNLNGTDWMNDTEEIRTAIENGISLDEEQYFVYLDCIRKLTDVLTQRR